MTREETIEGYENQRKKFIESSFLSVDREKKSSILTMNLTFLFSCPV